MKKPGSSHPYGRLSEQDDMHSAYGDCIPVAPEGFEDEYSEFVSTDTAANRKNLKVMNKRNRTRSSESALINPQVGPVAKFLGKGKRGRYAPLTVPQHVYNPGREFSMITDPYRGM